MTSWELWKERAEAAGTVVTECADADAVAACVAALAAALAKREPRRDLISGQAAEKMLIALPKALRKVLPKVLKDTPGGTDWGNIIRRRLNPEAICLDGGLRAYPGGIDLGVAVASALVADTGSCIVDGTDEDVRLATMLPDVSVIVASRDSVLPDLAAACDTMDGLLGGDAPRNVTFITGPSRTADIERVLTLGVHGPLELHVLVVPTV